MKKGLHCSWLWMLLVCPCVQNRIVCLGKRCKANCTFSAEKYTWFTIWKLLPPHPPSPPHLFTYNSQNKTEHKRPVFFTTSDIWQFQNTPLHSLSVHYQSIFIVIGMSLLLQFIVVSTHTHTHCKKQVTKATVPTGVLLLLLGISSRQCFSSDTTSETVRLSPRVERVRPQGQRDLRAPSSACPPPEGPSHRHTVCVAPWCVVGKSLFRGRVRFFLFSFLSFFLSFRCCSPQNRFSSKIAIKSLWKFMSIVAAIWREKRTTKHENYVYYLRVHLQTSGKLLIQLEIRNLFYLQIDLFSCGALLWSFTIQ